MSTTHGKMNADERRLVKPREENCSSNEFLENSDSEAIFASGKA